MLTDCPDKRFPISKPNANALSPLPLLIPANIRVGSAAALPVPPQSETIPALCFSGESVNNPKGKPVDKPKDYA